MNQLPASGLITEWTTAEIVSLDVTAGDDVAFATALLRCGTDEELRKDPETAYA